MKYYRYLSQNDELLMRISDNTWRILEEKAIRNGILSIKYRYMMADLIPNLILNLTMMTNNDGKENPKKFRAYVNALKANLNCEDFSLSLSLYIYI